MILLRGIACVLCFCRKMKHENVRIWDKRLQAQSGGGLGASGQRLVPSKIRRQEWALLIFATSAKFLLNFTTFLFVKPAHVNSQLNHLLIRPLNIHTHTHMHKSLSSVSLSCIFFISFISGDDVTLALEGEHMVEFGGCV